MYRYIYIFQTNSSGKCVQHTATTSGPFLFSFSFFFHEHGFVDTLHI